MAPHINEGTIATIEEEKAGSRFWDIQNRLGRGLDSRSLFPTPGSTTPSRPTRIKEIGRIGYEINVNRFFFKCVPPRCPEEGDAELKKALREIAEWLGEVTE